MPLRPARRLPRNFNRRAGAISKNIAVRYAQRFGMKARQRRMATNISRFTTALTGLLKSEGRFWLLFLVVALTGIVIGVVLFSPLFSVRSIRVLRQDPRVDIEDVQRTLAPLFRTKLPLVSVGTVSVLLQQRFPDVTHVELRKEYPSTLFVKLHSDPLLAEIIIQAPGAVGTGSGSGLSASGAYAYVTQGGLTVISPVELTTKPLPRLHISDWEVIPENRSLLLEPESLRLILHAHDSLISDFGLPIKQTLIVLRAREFHFQTGTLWLWFDLESTLPAQFDRFRSYLKAGPLTRAQQYIDLRIANRVIYK